VLGATLVLADGTIASAGGKVVKNVAGYDLARLVCGSEGRLAFIARVSFRLHPLPKATRTLLVETADTATVAASLLASQLQPSALDLLHPGRVAVLFEGSERAVAAQLTAAQTLVAGEEADLSVWDESRDRQVAAKGRVLFTPGDLRAALAGLDAAVVRPASGVAYTERPGDTVSAGQSGAELLVEAIRGQLDPQGVLAA
jgi:glycolate oxidase FAD binding subunit